MPPLESVVDKYQLAVMWVRLTDTNGRPRSDAAGQPIVSKTAVEVSVRWKDVHKEGPDKDGNTVTIDAEIALAMDLPIGSALWKGKLSDLPGGGIPGTDVMTVSAFFKWTPDVKGRNVRQTYGLQRLKDALPTTA